MTGRNGFSLLEMLVALTILGLTLLLVTQALRFSVQAMDHMEQARTTGVVDPTARASLRRIVERALPAKDLAKQTARKDDPPPVLLDGTAQSLTFLSITEPLGRVMLVRLRSTSDGLTVETCPPPPVWSLTCETGWAGRLSLPGLRNGQISLLDPDATGQWRSTWRRQTRLPKAIRIRARSPNEENRDIVILLKRSGGSV